MKEVGNGMHTAFWKDCWKGLDTLENCFPRLFALENEKLAIVANRIKSDFCWRWRRPIRGGNEEEELIQLEKTLKDNVLSNRSIGWNWRHDPKGGFSVGLLKQLLE